MNFWSRITGTGGAREAPERAIAQRQEQKLRSAVADEEYYRAMRRFALEAGDAEGVRFYGQKLSDLKLLRYELEALQGGRDTRS